MTFVTVLPMLGATETTIQVDFHLIVEMVMAVVGAMGLVIAFLIRRDLGHVDRKLALVDQHHTMLAVLDERSKRHEAERKGLETAIAALRARYDDVLGILAKHGFTSGVRRADR